MITLILKAATPLGFGQPDFYIKKIKVEDTEDAINRAKINFALENNIDLFTIKTEVLR